MRNLAKYPLRAGEAVDMLKTASAKEAERAVPGDMLAMTLHEAAAFIDANAAQFEESLRVKAEAVACEVRERRS